MPSLRWYYYIFMKPSRSSSEPSFTKNAGPRNMERGHYKQGILQPGAFERVIDAS